MALIDTLFSNTSNIIFQSDTIQIEADLMMAASHTRTASVPEDPIESGSVSDQIVNGQRVVAISGFVTNYPTKTYSVISGAINTPPNTVQDVFDKLEQLYDSREPFTVITRRKVYESMAFESLSMPESVEDGTDAMMFSATLKHIDIQNSITVAIPADVLNDADKGALQSQTNAGRQPTKPATSKEEERVSALFWFVN